MIEYIECRNSKRELVGIIDNFTSVIWNTEYNGPGEFEIYVSFNQDYFNWLSIDNYVTRYDREEIGVIESVVLDYSPETGRMIKAVGRFALCLLERRIWADIINSKYRCIVNIIPDNTKAEAACLRIVNETIINPDWERRKIDFITSETTGLSKTINQKQSTYQNVLNLTQEICKSVLYGQKMIFNRRDLTVQYKLYEGTDRSDLLVFSQNYDNLLSFEYSCDVTNYKNGFLIAGEGEGKDRFYTFCERNNTISTGVTRREYCYESGMSITYLDKNQGEHTYSNADYNQILINDCKSKFSEYSSLVNITGNVDLSLLILDKDYSVGDLVTVRDVETGITTKARIWSVTETQDENGYSVEASFEESE